MKIFVSTIQLGFNVYIGGCRQWIEFVPEGAGRYVHISNSDIEANAICRSEVYRRGVMAIEEADEEAPVSTETAVEGIRTVPEALRFLDEKGYSGPRLRTKAEIKQKALEMGYNLVGFIQ